MKTVVLPMEERHLEALADIERACFSHPWSVSVLRSELSDPTAVFLVAEAEGQPIGYVGMQAVLGEGYIANVAVSPSFRRQGVGESLMQALETYALTHEMAFLTLEVRASNAPAIALYRKLGYLPVGRRPRFYEDPSEDALLMTRSFSKA